VTRAETIASTNKTNSWQKAGSPCLQASGVWIKFCKLSSQGTTGANKVGLVRLKVCPSQPDFSKVQAKPNPRQFSCWVGFTAGWILVRLNLDRLLSKSLIEIPIEKQSTNNLNCVAAEHREKTSYSQSILTKKKRARFITLFL